MNYIGLRELREKTTDVEKKVAQGHSFVVFKRSKPIFRLAPVEDTETWEEVIDFTKLQKGGVPISDILSRL